MTTTPIHAEERQDALTDRHPDGHEDRRVDVQTDVFTVSGAGAGPMEGAFVIVLANHLCRIRHRWFCAEALVMPSRVG